ncbi:MAG: UDP-N-acetylmuramoylalanyl-D-glutamyl-2,6-diaminopimelate--D-alanyl-D-alanine ligase [Pseudomonadota bacterium]
MAEPLWTMEDVVAAIGGTLEGGPGGPLTGVSIDSRTIEPGNIYVAIKGDVHDGHKFAGAALEAGAGLAIVSKPDDSMRGKGPLLVVEDDPLDAMERLGRAARARSAAKIAAITGSVGKTGSKEMLRQALAKSGSVHASVKSFNNHWGVPLTLARFPQDAQFGVFEVGMNHPGEITPLVGMIRPHVAVITTVAPVHLGHFSSVEEIADAKAEIFTGVETGGTAVLNRDNAHFKRLLASAKAVGIDHIVTFGEHEDADAKLIKTVLHGSCSCVQATVLGDEMTYKLGAPGRHFVDNSLAVLAVVKLLGADLALAALSLAETEAPVGRGARCTLHLPSGDTATLIDEAYNANPASMRAALSLLGQARPADRGRRIAVLGDMLELGENAPSLHAELLGPIDEAQVDTVYACGPMMAHLWEGLPTRRRGEYAETSEGLTEAVLHDLRAGDVIMVKGSLGSKMIPIVDALKHRFPEREAT